MRMDSTSRRHDPLCHLQTGPFYHQTTKKPPLCFQFLENTECWMKTGHSDWFLALPVLFTIVLNIYFLVRVIMILRQLGEQQKGILAMISTNLRSKLPDTGSPRPAPTRASIKQVLFNIYIYVCFVDVLPCLQVSPVRKSSHFQLLKLSVQP